MVVHDRGLIDADGGVCLRRFHEERVVPRELFHRLIRKQHRARCDSHAGCLQTAPNGILCVGNLQRLGARPGEGDTEPFKRCWRLSLPRGVTAERLDEVEDHLRREGRKQLTERGHGVRNRNDVHQPAALRQRSANRLCRLRDLGIGIERAEELLRGRSSCIEIVVVVEHDAAAAALR